MTAAGEGAPGGVPAEPLTAAEDGLARIREALESAARGEVGGDELADELKGFVDQHGPALKQAAAAVGEEARRQALEQLYEWRARLAEQLPERGQQP